MALSRIVGMFSVTVGFIGVLVERFTTHDVPTMLMHITTILTGIAVLIISKDK